MIEERDANPTADTPGRFRGRRAPTALTVGGTESSEVVARLSGTESSNPLPSSGEFSANLTQTTREEVAREDPALKRAGRCSVPRRRNPPPAESLRTIGPSVADWLTEGHRSMRARRGKGHCDSARSG
jgi:hypothetical protein